MPTITFIRRAYSPSGGAEKYLLRLADTITKHGWTPQLVSAAHWPEDEWIWGNTYNIKGSSPMEFAENFKELQKKHDLGITFSLERVWEADFYRAGDGVHKAWLERLKGHSSPVSNFFRKIKKKHREILALETSLYAPPSKTRIIANSHLVAQEIKTNYHTEPERIQVIHNGYNANLPSAQQAAETRQLKRAELSLKENEIALLFVGSGWKRKGADFAILAMENLATHPVKLIIAGKGKTTHPIPSNVTLLGEVKDIPSLLLACDLFILPTLYDPFSNATLEAACFGLPVITTQQNGFSEALQSFGGGTILRDPTDISEIASAILSWLPPERRQHAKPKLKALAQHHTQEINLNETLQFLIPHS